ncbi:MAG: ABC transporter substrate-binding protein [Acidimicrobiia bacterium]
MDTTPTPVRLGIFHDFPQGDGGESFEAAVRLGLDDIGSRFSRPVEIITRNARGLPLGSEHELTTAFYELEAEGVLIMIGPSISDNGLIARDLVDEVGVASINYTGGERTRSEWMFHYQVGSLEEEPAILAQRLADRGLRRAAVVHDQSPVGNRYAECFEAARATLGLETTAATSISPLAEDLAGVVVRTRDTAPDALVYLGLGVSSRAVALALADAKWDVPVVANSALMFGYARPDWRDGWKGWEYVDGIADDNPIRKRLGERDGRAAAGPVGCAAYDMGRIIGEALARADHLTRDGLRESLERVKLLPATCGHDGTTMGFGCYDHAALKGRYLVLREWRDGRSVQVG